jgi:hypothetical protein
VNEPFYLLSCHAQIIALAASFAATHIYYASEPEEAVMDPSIAWKVVGSLSSAWLCFFLTFLRLMKPGYKGTFFSLRTGHAWAKSYFLDNDEDRIKMMVHKRNRKQWTSIREDVKAFMWENWEHWEEEEPEWFNDAFRASVDDDMLPPAALRALKMAGGGVRRRSSLGERLGGQQSTLSK